MNQHKAESWQVRNITFFLVAVVLLFLFRSLWTYPVEHGDAVQKYFYAGEILRSADWGGLLINHHSMRWSAMLPQIGLTWLLGTRYEVFYILPLLVFSLYVVLIVFSMRRTLNYSQQLLLVTILISEPMSFLTSNQYLVPGLGIFFAFAGILLLVNQSKRPSLVIMLSAVCFFISYGAHVTYLSFAGGGVLWLLFYQHKPSRAILFCVTILLLFIVETLVFNYLSDWELTLGRLEALAYGPHVGRNLTYTSVTFSQLFSRWLTLPLPHILLCFIFFMTVPSLFLLKKRGMQIPAFIECTLLVGLSFAISITFAVYSIDPLRPVMPFSPRYLIPFLPFASIMVVFMLSLLVSRVSQQIKPGSELIVSLGFALVLLITPTLKLDFISNKFNAFLWSANEEYTEFAGMFRDGELNLTGKRKVVYSMIARFKYPVKIRNSKSGLSVIDLATDHLCVDQLDQSPLSLNYEDCSRLKVPGT